MNISTGNQLAQNQQMTIAPKTIEDLKILQMSVVDLMQYIEKELVENPLLEAEYQEDFIDKIISVKEKDRSFENDETEVNDDSDKDFTAYISAPVSLKEYLMLQVGELKIGPDYRRLIENIMENIDEDGYLRISAIEISTHLKVPVNKAETALKMIQSLEPEGVGARNLKECLLIQLKRKNLLDACIRKVINDYLELLAERKYKEIARKLRITQETVIEIHRIIKGLNPKPGLQYTGSETVYIVPELTVKEAGGEYSVIFSDEKIPVLKLNDYYYGLIKRESSSLETYKYLKGKISKAVELINAIEQRKRTVLNIANFIVAYQEDFLKKGYQYLKPMTMRMAADGVGLHESTVSRTVNDKYIQTPRGIFELKFFFSSGIESGSSSNIVSSKSVKDVIKKIISEEDKDSPLCDEGIKKILEAKGIRIARRTVAKYREELSILPAYMRKINV